MAHVTNLKNKTERDEFTKNKKVIIFYSSKHCPACVDIKPLYERIAKRYGNKVSFSILDREEAGLQLDTVPIFEGYCDGIGVKYMEGVDTQSLKQFIGIMIKEKSIK